MDSLGAVADNESGVTRDDWVDRGPFGKGKHLVVPQFVDNVVR